MKLEENTKLNTRPVEIKITVRQLLDLIHWARRYCDGRRTGAPHSFNKMYWEIINRYPDIADMDKQQTDDSIKFFPFAQDGMYEVMDGDFDALSQEMYDYHIKESRRDLE